VKVSIQNLNQFNSYLEKEESRLENGEENAYETKRKVAQLIEENTDIVAGSDFKEVSRLLKIVKHIDACSATPVKSGGALKTFIEHAFSSIFGIKSESWNKERGLAGFAIDTIAAHSGSLKLEEIQKFKDIDVFLYYESLAQHISDRRLPIASLNMSKEDMLKTAQFLTHLDLTGATDPQKFSNEFIYDLLKNSSKLQTLIIKDNNFNPQEFSSLNKTGLKNLEIAYCPNFMPILNDLPKLESLFIKGSSTFNQSLRNLQNLKSLNILNCPAFQIQDPQTEQLIERLIPGFKEISQIIESPPEKVDEIPEEMIDPVTIEPMTNPLHYPSTPTYNLDQSTWEKLRYHPLTRERIYTDKLVPDSVLKTRIERLKAIQPELWEE
jgi:hypothetical protein